MKLKIAAVAPIVIIGVLPLLGVHTFLLKLVFLFVIYLAMAYSWNLIGGLTGQINLGHAAFFGIGAYVMAQAVIGGVHPYLAVTLGGVAGFAIATAMSPLLRLRGDYFAIGTLGFTEAMKIALINIHAYGYTFPPDPNITFTTNYYSAIGLLILVGLLSYYILRSRYRLAFLSIRENEILAEASGIETTKYKFIALCLSGLTAGLLGGLYCYNLLYVQPEHVFGLEWTIIPIFIVLIGGKGTLIGPVIGLFIYLGLYYALGFLITEYSLLIFGLIVIAVMKFFPEGIVEKVFYGLLRLERRPIL